jgi:outer membrane protein
MQKIIVSFILSVSFYLPAFLQDTLNLTCEQAIKIALDESYTMKSNNTSKQSLYYNYLYNKAMFKPKLDFSVNTPLWEESVVRIDRPDSLPVYNSDGLFRLGGNVSFQYTLPTGGYLGLATNLFRENITTVLASSNQEFTTDQFYSKYWVEFTQPVFTKNELRENLKEAEYNYQKADFYFQRSQVNIVYQVTQEFYGLYKLLKEVEIGEEKLINSERSYQIALLKSGSGRIAKVDMLSAEVSVARDKANLVKLYNALKTQEDYFKQIIGIDLNKPIRINTDLSYRFFIIDDTLAMQEALKNRYDIKEGEIDIKLKEIGIDRAKRENEFKGYISAYYDLTGISTSNSTNTIDLIESSHANIANRPPNMGVALTFSIPIYDWGRRKSKIREAEYILQQSKYNLEDLTITIEREVRQVIRTVRESHEQLTIYEKNLEVARQAFDIALLQFENGNLSNQELSIEREKLAGIQLEYLNAFIAYQLAVNDLKRKTLWDFENNRSYVIE